MRRPFITRFVLCAGCLWAGAASLRAANVVFPGPKPGPATAEQAASLFTLSNRVLAATWRVDDRGLHPHAFTDKLTGRREAQTDHELFRLGTRSDPTAWTGVVVAVDLGDDAVRARASRDGIAWVELARFPRAQFTGLPTRVRIGKMDLKAQARDHYDHGPVGAGRISEIAPAPATHPDGCFVFHTGAHQAAVLEFPFPPGARTVSCRIDKGTDQGLSWSPALAVIWAEQSAFLLVGLRDGHPTFNLTTAGGEVMKSVTLPSYPTFDLPATAFRMSAAPQILPAPPAPLGVREADRAPGQALAADFVSTNGIRAHWRAELRDGASYVRTTLALSTEGQTSHLYGVELVDAHFGEAQTIGTVPGCPVSAAGFFAGVEMPGAQNALSGVRTRIGFPCQLDLTPSEPYTFGAVLGVAPAGQLRRAFLCYVERERARPSTPFLHYNCWYDLGFGVSASNLLEVAQAFDRELVRQRGVPVQSYLVDDGWDDPARGLWVEQAGKFPAGLAGLGAALKSLDARLSIWISPLGGYGGAPERLAWAHRMGLLPANHAFDLAQPAYRQWFQNRCLQLMREAGVNAFKWDKAGEGVSPHFMALLDVARRLRRQDPQVFINVTVGTWPSPFWLNHIDATWRNGSADVGWAGPGDTREQWITFRDGYARKLFVEASPLYPLNSAMHHGIVHGRCFQGEKVGQSGPDLRREARSYFANGASLQELYLTPSMMTSNAWDDIAAAARWAHARADVLVDAHWVGGDPLRGEVYGYAAWQPRLGTLMVRNPSDQPQSILLDAAPIFELPAGAPIHYALRSPYPDQRVSSLALTAGTPTAVDLQPFEVLVFDALPRAR